MVRAGYKQTEVGEIPEDWGVQEFQQSLDRLNAKNHQIQTREYREHGRHPVVDQGKKPVVGYSDADEKLLHVDDGGVIVFGDHTCITKYVNFPFVVGADGTQIIRSKNGDDTRFRYYDLEHKGIEPTGYNRHFSKLKERAFVTPKPSEQKAIADALSDVDALIGSLEKLIAKKRDMKTAAMQQLLTGKTRLPGFGGAWKTVSIEKNAYLKARIGWQALTTQEYLDAGDYRLVTGTDFNNGRISWDTCWYVSEWRYAQDRHIQLQAKDVLITKDGTIGKVGYVEEIEIPATLNSGVFVIRPIKEAFEPKFLYYIISSRIFDDFLDEITAGSTITHLYQKDFVKFCFDAPCLGEQEAISTILYDLDSEIEKLENRLTKTKAIKQGMMQELLTGRTRLV